MILRVWRRLATLRPFVKPSFTGVQHPEQLLYNKEFTLKQIKQINDSKLNPKEHTPLKRLARGLGIHGKQYEQLHAAEFTLDAYDDARQSFSVKFNPYLNKHTIDASIEAVDIGYKPFDPTKHISLQQKVPTMNQYQIGDRELLLFNLPPNVTASDISSLFPDIKPRTVSFEYCMLGLPAVARVQFQTQGMTQNILATYEKSGIEHPSGKLVLVRGPQQQNPISAKSLELKHRTLAISELPAQLSTEQFFTELSRFGRITYFYIPLNLRRKANKEQFKKQFKGSDQVVRLVEHRDDGTIEAEYYPPSPEANVPPTSEVQLNSYLEKVFEPGWETEKERYDRRIRYSMDVDCYESPNVDPLILTNRGYCLVQYSCMEEAQNCYFHLMNRLKVQPVTKHEFEYDEQHKKEVLRYISKRVGEHKLKRYEQDMEMLIENVDEMEMQPTLKGELLARDDEIFDILEAEDEGDRLDIHSDPELLAAEHQRKSLRTFKRAKVAKNTPKSFDQIAEIELFGKVLPELKQTKQKETPIKQDKHLELDVDNNDPYVNLLESPEVGFAQSESNRMDNYYAKLERYQELIREQESKDRARRNKAPTEEQIEQLTEAAEGAEEDASDVPKAGFSTVKPRVPVIQLSKQEKYSRLKAYNEMMKKLIDEYFGKFSKKKLQTQQKTYRFPTLNMNRVFKQDKSDYLTEEELPLVMRMHSDQDEAHDLFDNYHRMEQVFKSLPYGERERILEEAKNGYAQVLQQLADFGEVSEVFEAPEDQDPESLVKQINFAEAKHGQHYSVLDKDGKKLVIKTARIDPLLDLTHIEKLRLNKDKYASKLSHEQKVKLEKLVSECQQTGKMIPDSLYAQFGKEKIDKSVEKAIEQLMEETGIPRKCKSDVKVVFENALSLGIGNEQTIQQDFAMQLELEKARLQTREITEKDFVKSAGMADVKSYRTGRYKTSRYRQR